MGIAFQEASASLAHDGYCAVGSSSLLHPHSGTNELQLLMALAPAPRPPDFSTQDKGTGLEEKLLSGRDASSFYNTPHLQCTEILRNDVCIEFLKVDSF